MAKNHCETAQTLVRDFARVLEANHVTDDMLDAFRDSGIAVDGNLHVGSTIRDAELLAGSAHVGHEARRNLIDLLRGLTTNGNGQG